jgi:hypothetical protein
MKRRLGGIVIIDGTDHEFLWPDEHGHQETAIDLPLEVNGGPVAVRVPHLKFGGEVRVELMLTAEAKADGAVLVSGAAKLYEGISENTSDLDAEQRIAFAVPKGGAPAVQHVFVGKPRKDRAEILICLTNALAE